MLKLSSIQNITNDRKETSSKSLWNSSGISIFDVLFDPTARGPEGFLSPPELADVDVVAPEEEEVEEEGIELEEITYKNNRYYKDNENFIYSIIDDEPSEIPVGYWKEKTQTIAFYKNK